MHKEWTLPAQNISIRSYEISDLLMVLLWLSNTKLTNTVLTNNWQEQGTKVEFLFLSILSISNTLGNHWGEKCNHPLKQCIVDLLEVTVQWDLPNEGNIHIYPCKMSLLVTGLHNWILAVMSNLSSRCSWLSCLFPETVAEQCLA